MVSKFYGNAIVLDDITNILTSDGMGQNVEGRMIKMPILKDN